jgi:hypothetical protein
MLHLNEPNHGHLGWRSLVLGAIAASFAVIAIPRLDSFLLLEPDSSDYVIMAHSLARSGEYRAPYDPSGVTYIWRPPGLSVLLLPAALARPGSIAACKVIVLFFSPGGGWDHGEPGWSGVGQRVRQPILDEHQI